MIRADVHMHTNFSHDSKSSPEEMIQGAIARGMEVICLTDHFDKDEMEWGAESIFDLAEYFRVLESLREKYREQIDIRIGVELGLSPTLGGYYREMLPQHPFDFVIGSVHSVGGRDPAAGELFQNRSDCEGYQRAFEETLADIENFSDYDVLGHIDYVVRYGKKRAQSYSYEAFADILDAILKRVIADGKGIELNMAGLKYGLPFAHPHPGVLKRYRELGGEIITVGSDGHCPEHIAYDYEKAADILKACGFTYYTEFSGRKPVFKQIL